jgi:integrase
LGLHERAWTLPRSWWLRPAELFGLRVSSVDMTWGVVHVTETLLPVHKFGDEPYQAAVTGPTETEAGDRSIPIPEWLCEELAEMLASRAAHRGAPIEPAEYLFQARYGNPINRDKLRQNVIRPTLVMGSLPRAFVPMPSGTRTLPSSST